MNDHRQPHGQARIPNQLARRRDAARRLPPIRLSCGCWARDPEFHRCPKRDRKEAA